MSDNKYETIVRIHTTAGDEDEAEDKAWEFLANADRRDIQFLTSLACPAGQWRNPNTGRCEKRKLLGW
ncbi:hypothetical protein KKE60_08210 [Patescibacteria group bacterium]|nr:hypothetical protein [Patescibacteria group bacterium]